MSIWLYVLKRVLMMIPALFGVTLITFILINLAPGGLIEQKVNQIRFGEGPRNLGGAGASSQTNQTVSTEVLDALKRQYGFDKPLLARYGTWLKNILHFDFGRSYVYGTSTLQVILSRFPVSLQFGVASFLVTYTLAISLGLLMARFENRFVDRLFSFVLLLTSSIPSFIVAVLLLVFFAGGSFLSLFPLGYLESADYETLSLHGKILDRIYHFILPLTAYTFGTFSGLTYLVRNSVVEVMQKDYIRMARAVGIAERRIFFKYALRNAMVPVVTGMGHFLEIFLSGSLLIETIFQLNGVGLLGYNSLMARDYNVIMGLTFLQSVALLVGNLVSDLANLAVDPRIDFAKV